MAANTSHERPLAGKKKDAWLKNTALLWAQAIDLVASRKRCAHQANALMRALQLFKEGRLGAVVPGYNVDDHKGASLQELLSLRIHSLVGPAKVATDFEFFYGVVYVGEYCRLPWDELLRAPSVHGSFIRDLDNLIYHGLNIPRGLDVSVEWEPPYADDPEFTRVMRLPTGEVLKVEERSSGFPRSHHRAGRHYIGQVLQHLSPSDKNLDEVLSLQTYLRGYGVRASMLVPSGFSFPGEVPQWWVDEQKRIEAAKRERESRKREQEERRYRQSRKDALLGSVRTTEERSKSICGFRSWLPGPNCSDIDLAFTLQQELRNWSLPRDNRYLTVMWFITLSISELVQCLPRTFSSERPQEFINDRLNAYAGLRLGMTFDEIDEILVDEFGAEPRVRPQETT